MQERPEPLGPEGSSKPSSVLSILLILLGALIVMLIVSASLQQPPPAGAAHPAVGTKLSQLEFFPLTGSRETIRMDQMQGNIVLLNFWGTWCPPCLQEMPEINELQQELANADEFLFVSVSCRNSEITLEELRKQTADYQQSMKFTFPAYHDYQFGSRSHLVREAKVAEFGYPTNVVLDREGTIIGYWSGYDPVVVEEIREIVQNAL